MLAPWLTGKVVDETGRFYVAFLVAACFALCGSLNFVFGVGPIKEIKWPSRVTSLLADPHPPLSNAPDVG